MNKGQVATIKKFLATLNEPAQSIAISMYNKIRLTDLKGEISQFSKVFFEACPTLATQPNRQTKKMTDTLGLANFFTWMSYSLYDGVYDQDLPANNIPVANILERKALELYQETNLNLQTVSTLFNNTDQANAWELSRCRFQPPNLETYIRNIPSKNDLIKMLASRSIAHIAGPVILFETSNHTTLQYQSLLEGLTLYCIARQLNDDLHDWVEDFQKGHITYVVAHLLTKVSYVQGSKVTTSSLLKKMKRAFYDSGIETICKETEQYITSSLHQLAKCGIRADSQFIVQFFLPILNSAQKAQTIHLQNKAFVTSYAKTQPTAAY